MQESGPKNSPLAITSLVLGILSIFCCGLLSGIPAIITGFMAKSRIRRSEGVQKGAGMATAGIILGFVSILISVATLVWMAPVIKQSMQAADVGLRGQKIVSAIQTADVWPADEGITSVTAFEEAMVAKGSVTSEQVAALRMNEFLIGNVSAADTDGTILLRTKPGEFTGNVICVFFKDGTLDVAESEEALSGIEPPRVPHYLAD